MERKGRGVCPLVRLEQFELGKDCTSIEFELKKITIQKEKVVTALTQKVEF